jgi:hypothetical protein
MTVKEFLASPCTGFSGKRPGNNDSDWDFILASALVEADLIVGEKTWNSKYEEWDVEFKWQDFHGFVPTLVDALVNA